jgi:hypothetical protein
MGNKSVEFTQHSNLFSRKFVLIVMGRSPGLHLVVHLPIKVSFNSGMQITTSFFSLQLRVQPPIYTGFPFKNFWKKPKIHLKTAANLHF